MEGACIHRITEVMNYFLFLSICSAFRYSPFKKRKCLPAITLWNTKPGEKNTHSDASLYWVVQIKLKCMYFSCSKNSLLTAATRFWCSYLKLICTMTVLSALLQWGIFHSDCPWPNQKINLISLMQKVIGFLFMECIPLMTVSASANLASADLTLIWWYDFK